MIDVVNWVNYIKKWNKFMWQFLLWKMCESLQSFCEINWTLISSNWEISQNVNAKKISLLLFNCSLFTSYRIEEVRKLINTWIDSFII